MFKRTPLETVVNICLIVACLAVTVGVVSRLLAERRPPGSPPGVEYSVGEVLPQIASTEQHSRTRTLLLFLSSRCAFCDEGMEFYSALASGREQWSFVSGKPGA
jgi:hypothetical protein